jgi:hypothetical protein
MVMLQTVGYENVPHRWMLLLSGLQMHHRKFLADRSPNSAEQSLQPNVLNLIVLAPSCLIQQMIPRS